jgi:hypothetical protein
MITASANRIRYVGADKFMLLWEDAVDAWSNQEPVTRDEIEGDNHHVREDDDYSI